MKKINVPYVFMSDSLLVAKHVFIPAKEIPELSTMYYQIIYERYFAKNENIIENFLN